MNTLYTELSTTTNEIDACEENLISLRESLAKATPIQGVKLAKESDGSIVTRPWGNATDGNGNDTPYSDGGVAEILQSIKEAIPYAQTTSVRVKLTTIIEAFEFLGFKAATSDADTIQLAAR